MQPISSLPPPLLVSLIHTAAAAAAAAAAHTNNFSLPYLFPYLFSLSLFLFH